MININLKKNFRKSFHFPFYIGLHSNREFLHILWLSMLTTHQATDRTQDIVMDSTPHPHLRRYSFSSIPQHCRILHTWVVACPPYRHFEQIRKHVVDQFCLGLGPTYIQYLHEFADVMVYGAKTLKTFAVLDVSSTWQRPLHWVERLSEVFYVNICGFIV